VVEEAGGMGCVIPHQHEAHDVCRRGLQQAQDGGPVLDPAPALQRVDHVDDAAAHALDERLCERDDAPDDARPLALSLLPGAV